jgi:hypothetical protein
MTEKWSRPEPRQVKLNVDASFYDDLKAGATRAVLRDYKGEFIAASSTYIPHVPSAIDAWLMASLLGTPRGRCDEYSSKIFPQLRNQGLSIRRGETND